MNIFVLSLSSGLFRLSLSSLLSTYMLYKHFSSNRRSFVLFPTSTYIQQPSVQKLFLCSSLQSLNFVEVKALEIYFNIL